MSILIPNLYRGIVVHKIKTTKIAFKGDDFTLPYWLLH